MATLADGPYAGFGSSGVPTGGMLPGSAGPPLRGFPRPGAARRAFARARGNAAQAVRAHPCLTRRRRPSMTCLPHPRSGRRFGDSLSQTLYWQPKIKSCAGEAPLLWERPLPRCSCLEIKAIAAMAAPTDMSGAFLWESKRRCLRQGEPCPGGRGPRQARHGWRAPDSGHDVLRREKRLPADRARHPTGVRASTCRASPRVNKRGRGFPRPLPDDGVSAAYARPACFITSAA